MAPAYITVDREAALHRRRKAAMISLLAQFEREIEPHVVGHRKQIDDFKRSCREKLNALTFEAIELMKLQPGEDLNDLAVELAAQRGFGDNGGRH
jgi:hypothetical protein